MLAPIAFDTTSLNVVYSELHKTLLSIGKELESYSQDLSNVSELESTQVAFSQVAGILRLLEMPCAERLASLLYDLSLALPTQSNVAQTFSFKTFGHAIMGLNCYLEYVIDTEQRFSALLAPFNNEILTALRRPLVLEHTEAGFKAVEKRLSAEGNAAHTNASINDLFKRVRALYQVGLLGLLNEENTKAKLTLMYRSMKRLAAHLSHTEHRTQWQLAEDVLHAVLNGDLSVSFTRKRLLARLDASLREAGKLTNAADFAGDPSLITELAYLLTLVDNANPHKGLTQLTLTVSETTDQKLQAERSIMQGPSSATVKALVSVIMQDMIEIKNTLEALAEGFEPEHNFQDMVSQLLKIKSVLALVGATEASQLVNVIIDRISQFGEQVTKDQLDQMADLLLQLDSLLNNLTKLDLIAVSKQQAESVLNPEQLLSANQLKAAEKQFIAESLTSLQQAREAFNAYLESNYSANYLNDILLFIGSLKGAIDMLGHSRAAAMLVRIMELIRGFEQRSPDASDADDALQSIADTLIALEYYLSELHQGAKAPVAVLQIAENSLNAQAATV